MKIKIISNCIVEGAHVESGATVDVTEATVKKLIGMGRARLPVDFHEAFSESVPIENKMISSRNLLKRG